MKSTDGNESRAYLCIHEFEKTGKDPGKTRLEHSQIFVDFEENKKKRSFKRKMVLGITPNTKFVYSLGGPIGPLFHIVHPILPADHYNNSCCLKEEDRQRWSLRSAAFPGQIHLFPWER